ncbi:DNA repair protein RadC [bacterium]|nr:DNA repair protein RadC [bacterium]
MKLTSKLKRAGSFLDIPVLDHIILTKEDYCSLADNGIL